MRIIFKLFNALIELFIVLFVIVALTYIFGYIIATANYTQAQYTENNVTHTTNGVCREGYLFTGSGEGFVQVLNIDGKAIPCTNVTVKGEEFKSFAEFDRFMIQKLKVMFSGGPND